MAKTKRPLMTPQIQPEESQAYRVTTDKRISGDFTHSVVVRARRREGSWSSWLCLICMAAPYACEHVDAVKAMLAAQETKENTDA